ncbi:MAG: DUF6497 family protein [Paracoccaceae bacterium]
MPGLIRFGLIGALLAGLGGLAYVAWPVAPKAPKGSGAVEVPSGQEIRFVEMIQDTAGVGGLTYRFRFVAPAIARDGGSVSQEEAIEDMQAICENFALPRLASTGPVPAQIIISFADRPVVFGEANPDATQYFEAFSPADDSCIWEGY